ncbi:putative defense protein 3 [Aplysia californica]|uniref:Defense protein 3 n=1 Tax=Aplysia californica TaxID=6500 RepID=A0ABM0K6D9_APLCA|nr:putative defense protein 3 [Aplysia californica]
MASTCFIILAALVISIIDVDVVEPYPEGAPESTCKDMRPQHKVGKNDSNPLIDPMGGISVYMIQASKKENVMPGDKVEVTIMSNAPEEYFEGFQVQARSKDEEVTDVSTIMRYGTFTVNDARVKTLCENGSVTHAVHEHMHNVSFTWTAPSQKLENIVFKATVVKGYSTFYMHLKSDVINENNSCNNVIPSIAIMAFAAIFALNQARSNY